MPGEEVVEIIPGRMTTKKDEERIVDGAIKFETRAKRYPLLTAEQEVLLFQVKEQEQLLEQQRRRPLTEQEKRRTVLQLRTNPDFQQSIDPDAKRQNFDTAFADSETIDTLIANCNLGLVYSLVTRRPTEHMSKEDKFQEGYTGLMKAIEKFDYTKGFKFSTYAIWWIRQSIQRAVYDQEDVIRIPVHTREAMNRARAVEKEFEQEHGHKPSTKEWTEALLGDSQLEPEAATRAIDIITKKQTQVFSLDEEFNDHSSKSGQTELTLAETIADPETTNAAMDFAIDYGHKKAVGEALFRLTEREELVMRLRFGLDNEGGKTLNEIGDTLGLSRERIRQIEAKAMQKLKLDGDLRAVWSDDEEQPSMRQTGQQTVFTHTRPERPQRTPTHTEKPKQQAREKTPWARRTLSIDQVQQMSHSNGDAVTKALSNLSSDEMLVISLLGGIEQSRALSEKETCTALSMTRAKVRKIRSSALDKLSKDSNLFPKE